MSALQTLVIVVQGRHAIEAAKKSRKCKILEMDASAKEPSAKVQVPFYVSSLDWLDENTEQCPKRILALDGIQDPQNFGALMRSAHFFGFHAVLFPKDRSAPLSAVSAKASSGAYAQIDLIRCVNLGRELDQLKKQGFWAMGLKGSGKQNIPSQKFAKNHVVLVVGSEGEGLHRVIEERCDDWVSFVSPTGRDSLNASVAAGIAMFHFQVPS